MRKPLLCGTTSSNISSKINAIKIEDMSGSGVPNFDVAVGVETSRVDRVRKIISSPLTKKKSSSNVNITFGLPLDDQQLQRRIVTAGGVVVLDSSTRSVPFVVHRICDYIECNGFHHEGLFRISGSVRIMEKLRASFDRNGDADLEETADVMAAAGLLKQFLRALPEPVIPTNMHAKFLKVQKEYCHPSNEDCIRQLKRLVEQLPEPNFNLLKYLMGFLVKVSAAEQTNRMNANSLGIVFGPSVFRLSDIADVEGLKEQSIANQIVTKFVRDYSAIFEVDTSVPVSTTSSSSSSAIVSRRKLDVASSVVTSPTTSSLASCSPQPNDKAKTNKECNSAVKLDASMTVAPQTNVSMSFSSVLDSPKDAQFEDNRNKVIEMTISNAVCRNIYGENSGQDKLRPPLRLKHKKLELSPDGAANNKLARSNSEERSTSDKQRQQHHSEGLAMTHGFGVGLAMVRKCSSHEDVFDAERLTATKLTAATENKLRQQHEDKPPTDNASMKKLDSGHGSNPSQAMTPLNIDTSTQAIPDLRKRDWGRHHDGENECSEARRSMERLQNFSQFQRSTGTSKVRRPATLKGSRRCASMEVVRNDDADDDSLKENFGSPSSCGDRSRVTKPFQKRSSSLTLVESPTSATMDDDPMRDELELDETEVTEATEEALQTKRKENAADVGDPRKPRLWLLDLHDVTPASHQEDQRMSPSASTHKSYVPPLDLATLHEHGDGSDPIPTNHLRASWPFIHSHQTIHDEVMLSPRTNSLEKMSSAFIDASVPPSPPYVQDISRKSASFKDEEEREASFRVLNKKISSLKRKIKQYEDDFEDDYGYRPSHAEKMSQGEIKKYMTELAKARKELKQLKEEARLVSMATSFSLSGGQMSNGVIGDVNQNGKCGKTPAMEASLDDMMRKVSCKRRAANRPEALEDMSGEEVLEEKLVIQKALLHFENIHGRPVTKQEKELMKPIYERYRNVKRLAVKASSPKMKDPSMELQPILEHETMDFTQASPKHQRFLPGDGGDGVAALNDDVFSPRAKSYDLVAVDADANNSVFPGGLDEDTSDEVAKITADDPEMRTAKRKLQEDSCNLHELSHKQLLEHEWKVRSEKKRLRRILREFEEGFQRQTGRKAQREDRAPIDSVYLEYKQVKAKLKLLEALLTKHEHHYTI